MSRTLLSRPYPWPAGYGDLRHVSKVSLEGEEEEEPPDFVRTLGVAAMLADPEWRRPYITRIMREEAEREMAQLAAMGRPLAVPPDGTDGPAHEQESLEGEAEKKQGRSTEGEAEKMQEEKDDEEKPLLEPVEELTDSESESDSDTTDPSTSSEEAEPVWPSRVTGFV